MWVEMGIRRYYHRYRAIASVDGVQYQEYFDTVKEARAWRKSVIEEFGQKQRVKRPYLKTRKRDGCLFPELPIGLHEKLDYWVLADGTERMAPYIEAVVSDGGKVVKHLTARFGDCRSREEAIENVLTRREAFEKQYFGRRK